MALAPQKRCILLILKQSAIAGAAGWLLPSSGLGSGESGGT
jgi:hypothetical protein